MDRRAFLIGTAGAATALPAAAAQTAQRPGHSEYPEQKPSANLTVTVSPPRFARQDPAGFFTDIALRFTNAVNKVGASAVAARLDFQADSTFTLSDGYVAGGAAIRQFATGLPDRALSPLAAVSWLTTGPGASSLRRPDSKPGHHELPLALLSASGQSLDQSHRAPDHWAAFGLTRMVLDAVGSPTVPLDAGLDGNAAVAGLELCDVTMYGLANPIGDCGPRRSISRCPHHGRDRREQVGRIR